MIVRSANDGRRLPVSTDGGGHPRWSEDGRSIYYDAGRRLMKAAFHPEDGAAMAKPAAVVDNPIERAIAVTPSGRVLVERQPPSEGALFVLQWLRELRERLPLPVNTPR